MHCDSRSSRSRGFTLIEVVVAVGLLGLIAGGITTSFYTIQSAVDDEFTEADLLFRSRSAIDRLTRLCSTAVTTDARFALRDPTTGTDPWCLEFRELNSVTAGVANYDDKLVYHLFGPDGGATPCSGIVIGRGPDMTSIYDAAQGADGWLGTEDDNVTAAFVAGNPAVELLLPSVYAPQTGRMLTFVVDPASAGRMITITLRCNFRRTDGTYLRAADLVLSERVSLRW